MKKISPAGTVLLVTLFSCHLAGASDVVGEGLRISSSDRLFALTKNVFAYTSTEDESKNNYTITKGNYSFECGFVPRNDLDARILFGDVGEVNILTVFERLNLCNRVQSSPIPHLKLSVYEWKGMITAPYACIEKRNVTFNTVVLGPRLFALYFKWRF